MDQRHQVPYGVGGSREGAFGMSGQPAHIAPWISVRDATEAVEFYRRAFDAVESYRFESSPDTVEVAQLSFGGAGFWVSADPDAAAPGPVRMIISVGDPDSLFQQVRAAGATEVVAMNDAHGWHIGRLVDPFGHHWEIGRQL
ncbi:MAG TPA: VOC family protein [Pseudonocardiaceae bacterium]|nr:VOC family protein [Pseudonocardiaceae bacterium]